MLIWVGYVLKHVDAEHVIKTRGFQHVVLKLLGCGLYAPVGLQVVAVVVIRFDCTDLKPASACRRKKVPGPTTNLEQPPRPKILLKSREGVESRTVSIASFNARSESATIIYVGFGRCFITTNVCPAATATTKLTILAAETRRQLTATKGAQRFQRAFHLSEKFA